MIYGDGEPADADDALQMAGAVAADSGEEDAAKVRAELGNH